MGISKVIVNNVTKVDLTSDTVAANKLVSNYTAHDKAGNAVTGTIATKTASNVTVNGATVTVPAGLYESAVSKTVTSGSAATPATTITSNPSISVSSSGLITASNSKTQSVTPTVTAGYVSSGTAGTITVSGSNTQQLTTKAAATYTPGTTAQTIASGQYLTGAQTIKGDTNLIPENIADGVIIFGVTGTHSGGSPEELFLNFYDYDGTLLYTYDGADVATMTALPENPDHELELGIEAQGWNWTLNQIKSMNGAGANIIDVGQIYNRVTGSTNYTTIHVLDMPIGLNFWVQLYFSGNNTTVNVYCHGEQYVGQHYENQFGLIGPFSSVSDFDVEIEVISGAIEFKNNNTNCILRLDGGSDGYVNNRAVLDSIRNIYIGNRVYISNYAFYQCRYLETITIPNSQTITYGAIGDHAFEDCLRLKHVNFPHGGLGSIGDGTFKGCKNLRVVTLPGDAEFDIGEETFMNSGLEHTCLSDGIETIDVRAFKNSSLKHIGLNTWSTLYVFAEAFRDCSEFDGKFLAWDVPFCGSGMNQYSDYAFSGCLGIYASDNDNGVVVLPDTVWSIGTGLFYQSGINNFSFENLQEGNSSITVIPDYCFANCDYLQEIIIPASIEEIGEQAFANCPVLGLITFYSTTPPTVDNSNAFANLPTNCIIIVPSGCLSAYTSATNYPSSNTYHYDELID